MKSEWHGDSTNGIEIRHEGDFVDEVLLYVNGKCVFHMENMSDQCYWFALYAKGHDAHCNVFAKNNRSHLALMAEAWPTITSPTPTSSPHLSPSAAAAENPAAGQGAGRTNPCQKNSVP